MAGGYDLYGNYYPNANDAMNAEMSQCNEIDNRINEKRLLNLERKLQQQEPQQQEPQQEEGLQWLFEKVQELEKRLNHLESIM